MIQRHLSVHESQELTGGTMTCQIERKLQKEEKKERCEMTWHSYEGPGNMNGGGGEMGLCLGRCQKEGGGSLR